MVLNFEFADNVIGITIDTDVDKELMKEIIASILDRMKAHETINLFCELKRGKTISLQAFFENLKFNIKHRGEFCKIAVVTDRKWIKAVYEVNVELADANIKIFDNKDRLEALNWISS
ncbi:SpoIIAA family protein [Salinimicrobium oceani]|uniref:STAS/SEC14 domain-containing protein n=1 Tax=Salinimicrobium oceani TaxID=2722702 RepID=A0ABX1D2N3_9FLAO|nr:STAS/SEC14 domain-containing protein [Salinimicrobium oceani]NJW53597.1 STAS/SEC14 domain-containing protein [Salinimicrobium oceani]